MKIGFFGPYFLYFERIIQSCAEQNNSEYFLFTDKKSFSNFFKNIKCRYVDLENFHHKKKYNFSNKEIIKFFQCDDDRHIEFNVKKPSISKLNKAANLILNNFEAWYLETNPELLLCEGPDNFFNRVIIDYLEKNKIDFYTFRIGRISNSVYLEKNKKTIFNKIFQKKIYHEKDYMNSIFPLHRNTLYKFSHFKETSLFKDLNRLINFWPIIHKEDKLLVYTVRSIEVILKTRMLYIKEKLVKILLNLINKKRYSGSKEYLSYPEHYRPEASTSDLDYEYINDLENIKYIKRKIKKSIVFRFHPSYFTKRPILQFLKILFHSKEFISFPKQPLEELIINSQGSISVSSSFALDTIRLGKPSIVIGHPEYLNSKIIYDNLCVIRKESDFLKVNEYLETYKKIETNVLENELQKLYHPYNLYEGKWINILIRLCQK